MLSLAWPWTRKPNPRPPTPQPAIEEPAGIRILRERLEEHKRLISKVEAEEKVLRRES